MKEALIRIKEELGALGLASLLVIAAVAAFSIAAVKPLEHRKTELQHDLAGAERKLPRDGLTRVNAGAPAARLDAFYRFFDRPQRTDEWLAKMYGIATASGLALRSGDYRLADARQRLERYQVTLPVSGTYAQIRKFLEATLAEIPVVSLDQVTFRRKGPNEALIEAEIVLTLHLLRK